MSERARQPDEKELRAVIGAVLFAADEPVRPQEIASAAGGVELAEVERAIDELCARCKRSAIGLRVERIAGGVQMTTSSDVAPWVRQFFREQNKKRLSPPALETLAIVAYRQPVTVPEIQAIRGKDPTAALRGLVDRKLVQFLGRKKIVGNPMLYGTSKEFLVHFGLDSLDDLPPIEDFDQFVGAIEEKVAALEPTQEEPESPREAVEVADGGEPAEAG